MRTPLLAIASLLLVATVVSPRANQSSSYAGNWNITGSVDPTTPVSE